MAGRRRPSRHAVLRSRLKAQPHFCGNPHGATRARLFMPLMRPMRRGDLACRASALVRMIERNVSGSPLVTLLAPTLPADARRPSGGSLYSSGIKRRSLNVSHVGDGRRIVLRHVTLCDGVADAITPRASSLWDLPYDVRRRLCVLCLNQRGRTEPSCSRSLPL